MWNLITGKFISERKANINWDCSAYQHLNPYQQQGKAPFNKERVLIRSIKPVEGENYDNYCQPTQLQQLLEGQVTYGEKQRTNIYRWKYISIVNELEIDDIFEFYFPSYQSQALFISQTKDDFLMIEKLQDSSYLYKSQRISDRALKWV